MGKPELGTKFVCAGCSERFYDLNKSPAICPKCGVEQPPEKPRVVRPPRSTFGTRFRTPQPATPVTTQEDAGSADNAEEESEEDAPEADDDDDDDDDDDIEVEAGIVKTED